MGEVGSPEPEKIIFWYDKKMFIVLVILLVSLLVPKSATNLNDGLKNVAGALVTFGDSIATIRGDTVYEEKAVKVKGYIYADEVQEARRQAGFHRIIGSDYKTSSIIRIPLQDDDGKPIIVYYLLEDEEGQFIGELGNFNLLESHTYIDGELEYNQKKIKRRRWHNIGDWVIIQDKASVFDFGTDDTKIEIRKGLETWLVHYPSVDFSFKTKNELVEQYNKYKTDKKKKREKVVDKAVEVIFQNQEKKAKDPSCQCVDYGPYKSVKSSTGFYIDEEVYDNTNQTFTKFGHCKSWKIPGDVANDKNTMMPPNYYNPMNTPWCLTKQKNNGKCMDPNSSLGTKDEKIYNWKECVSEDTGENTKNNYTESKGGPSDPSDADIIRSHNLKLGS